MLVLADPAQAHERWFVEGSASQTWSFATQPMSLLFIASAVIVAVAWRAMSNTVAIRPVRRLAPFGKLSGWAPRLVALHIGASLVALAACSNFLAPSMELQDIPGGMALGWVEVVVGMCLLAGYRLRFNGWLLLAGAPVLLFMAGATAMVESATLFGAAAFLIIVTRQDLAAVFDVAPSPDVPVERLRGGLFLLRAGAGISLITLAFSEKLANPELARTMLQEYPQLNLFDMANLPWSADTFIRFAAAVELLFGLLLLSGALSQVASIVVAVPFTATLALFGPVELMGHLPMYGVLLAVLIYASDPTYAPLTSWLPGPKLRLANRWVSPVPSEVTVSPLLAKAPVHQASASMGHGAGTDPAEDETAAVAVAVAVAARLGPASASA
ncbi:MAG: hypothetical protein ACKV2O_18520 [Acidimicrobiales bacterium]